MIPLYYPGAFSTHPHSISIKSVLNTTPWIQVTDARLECFMSPSTETYTYGSGNGVRTYTPVAYSPIVAEVQQFLNRGLNEPSNYNVCFLNRYDNDRMHLGWHSDDSPGMNHDHPIAVVSFGHPREIWWRKIGETGIVPSSQRQLLEHGSIFVMPAGMQRTHQHRIPKGDCAMTTRVSMTFRNYAPIEATS